MLYAPKYYNNFKCIADKCSHSCCIGWEIDVNVDALEKYKKCEKEYAKDVLKSIDFLPEPHFRLSALERCPHLDEKGLCKIILNMGEDFLCHICSEHPRFYNETARGDEVGVGMACEEASRLILSSDEFNQFVLLEAGGEAEPWDFDATKHREGIYNILLDESLSHGKKLLLIYERYISPRVISTDDWKKVISSFEYLENGHKDMFLCFDPNAEPKNDQYLKRALAYYIFRHCSSATDEEEFLASLGFCLFLERLFASLLQKNENAVLAGRIISEELEYSTDNTDNVKNLFYDYLYLTNQCLDDNINT